MRKLVMWEMAAVQSVTAGKEIQPEMVMFPGQVIPELLALEHRPM
jgi:hypothetical protein